MIWFLILIFTFYSILIFSLTIGFKKVDEFNKISKNNSTSFSVVIPFRNEAENLPNLLESIAALKYPKELVEFILVDDDSSDNSVSIIDDFLNNRMTIRVINNKRTSNSPKKDAITTAISIAKNNWIVTTDADCIVPENWLGILEDIKERIIQWQSPQMGNILFQGVMIKE